MSELEGHRQEVAEDWDAYWQEYAQRSSPERKIAGLGVRSFLRRVLSSSGWSRLMVEILRREDPIASSRILEPGCGTGLASLSLAEQGATVTLLDTSPSALSQAAHKATDNGVAVNLIRGSIFDIPSEEAAFDLVWNEGVLEHFDRQERVRALSEMARVTRSGGKVIIIVPRARSRIYRAGKSYAEKHGRWEYGYEESIHSMAGEIGEVATLELLSERSYGWLLGLGFAEYFLPRSPIILKLFHGLLRMASLIFWPLNRLPGYFLVSVARKA